MDEKVLQKLVDVAKKELREDESTRRQALEQFRDWIEKNPDIRNCRTDDVYLLTFLRKGKFSVPTAQQTFLKYALFCETFPHFMKLNDITDPKMNPYVMNGYVYITPFRTEEGCRLSIIRNGRFDPYKCSYTDHVRALIVNTWTLMEDEATQVLGVVTVFDMADTTAAHLTHMPVSEIMACAKSLQQAFPLRYKGCHFINLSPLFKWLFDMIVSHLSSKMASRFFFHSNMEELYKYVDRKLLPKEYGGNIPEAEMIDLWYKELLSKQEMVVLSDKLRLVQMNDTNLNINIAALPGSFRKLDVD